MKLILIKEIFFLGILVLILHYFSLKWSLYWTIDSIDIFMHILGGFLIGLLIITFIQRVHVDEKILNKKLLFISVIFGVLTVALGWELWELFVGFTSIVDDQTDTVLDIIMGLLGGAGSIFYYYFKYLE